MTLFVTISGVQLWMVVRYVLHQLGASRLAQFQSPHLRTQQFILRNAHSGLATAQMMLGLACTSRRSSGKLSLRSYTIGLLAMAYALLFIAAEILSNFAISADSTNGGSPVLLRNRDCGIWNDTYNNLVTTGAFSTEEEFRLYIEYAAKTANDIQLSLEYAQECYLASSSTNMSSTCHIFKTTNLNWKTYKASCPFQAQLCHNDSSAMVLETGHIDSHDDLGINAKPGDRLKYQRKTTCAVLDSTRRVKGWDGLLAQSVSASPASEVAYAYFGPSLYKETEWTYSYSNFASLFTNFSAQVTLPYQIDAERALGQADPQWTASDFEPIAELFQERADLTLLFLSFIGTYLSAIDDPWFSAHNEQLFNTSLSLFNKRYARDEAISTLGCTEQHQFCTNSGVCTGFLGFDQVQNVPSFNNALTPLQNATFDRMLRAVGASRLGHVIEYLAVTTTPLLASNATLSGSSGAWVSGALPENQWEMELQYWHSIVMAQLQRTIVQWATGQIAAEPHYLIPPAVGQDVWFCNNLLVPSTVYQSFNVVAIIFMVGFGIFLIVVSLTIERLTALAKKCLGKSPPRRDWDHDDFLGLHRSGDNILGRPQPQPMVAGGQSATHQPEPSQSFEMDAIGRSTENNESYHLPSSFQGLPRSLVNSASATPDTRSPGLRAPPSTPARESWMTISLNSLNPPGTGIPSHISDDDIVKRDLTPNPSPRTPQFVHRANAARGNPETEGSGYDHLNGEHSKQSIQPF
ncbi:hypothetical protein LTR41_000181 [Exophiala xenobiotica]|nr:hypothetical protein LTR41_000181 [Exophiala xenobiotica]